MNVIFDNSQENFKIIPGLHFIVSYHSFSSGLKEAYIAKKANGYFFLFSAEAPFSLSEIKRIKLKKDLNEKKQFIFPEAAVANYPPPSDAVLERMVSEQEKSFLYTAFINASCIHHSILGTALERINFYSKKFGLKNLKYDLLLWPGAKDTEKKYLGEALRRMIKEGGNNKTIHIHKLPNHSDIEWIAYFPKERRIEFFSKKKNTAHKKNSGSKSQYTHLTPLKNISFYYDNAVSLYYNNTVLGRKL